MKRLHVGSGKIKLDGYINIDIEPSHEPDICADVLTLDYSDIDVIYSQHMIEHLIYPADTMRCLSLFYKWLKPGGILRISVPDLELAAKAYAEGRSLKFLYGEDFKGYYFRDTPAERLNFFVREWQHKMTFDFGLLHRLLSDVGFVNIFNREANESAITDFCHDRFISESLYVEAIK